MRRELDALASREHDLVVVGGGIYGAVAAWDAAQRGLEVALVEREDFGSGASWNSLKTIHGGLRYIRTGNLGRLRESARERSILLTIAPELVRPLPFLVPARGHGTEGREVLALALWFNDRLTRGRNRGLPPERQIPEGRMVSAAEARRLVPGLATTDLTGAAVWSDAQASSTERLTLAFVHAAAEAGARVANHLEAVGLLRLGKRVSGIAARDGLDGRTIEVRSRMVLNAAGPWAEELVAEAGVRRRSGALLRARNLVLRLAPPAPLAVGAKSEGRYLFLVPWQGLTLVGTSYESAAAPPSDPMAFREEAGRAFPWAGLEAAPVTLVHEGLVPGTVGGELATRPRLRDHEREDGLAGLVTVQGVKYTTARAVAERVVDLVVRRLRLAERPCRTAITPLRRARPLAGTLEQRVSEAVRDEMALTLADAVLRRLDLGTAGPPPSADLDAVCRVMAAERGWGDGRQAAERATLARVYPHA